MKEKFLKTVLLVLSAVFFMTISAAPFKADKDTLLLSGFENSLTEADYAAGVLGFYGSGATFAPGYYGKGIDLRGRTLAPDFEKTAEQGNSAIYTNMALFTYGNLLPDEGTLEMFVLVENFPKKVQPNHGMLLNAFVGRFIEDGKSYGSARMTLTRGRFEWRFPVWSNDNRDQWQGRIRFKPALKTGWHHLAVTWAKGEAVIFLDGKILATCDLKDKFGMTILHHLNHGVYLGGHVIDELRISSIARYKEEFEPNWKNGVRPKHAFPGLAATVRRYPAHYRPSPDGKLDTAVKLPGSDMSLTILESLDRKTLAFQKWEITRNGEFTGKYSEKLTVNGKISSLENNNGQRIELTFSNKGKKELYIETLLAFPNLPGENQIFDGADIKVVPGFSTYRDSYPSILPLTAAGNKYSFRGIALDPSFAYNDLISARSCWFGNAQGTKFALAPGEKFTVKFVTFRGQSRFGTAAALDEYYRIFSKYYHIDRKNTIYHYLPLTMHWRGFLPRNTQRLGYAGGYWGHGPYHTKGDETGTFWGKYPDDPSFKHAFKNEKSFKTRQQLLEAIQIDNRYEYDNGYGVRRYHANPDLTATWLIRELYPEWEIKDDPLNTGHYYKRVSSQFFVNEYQTPFAKFFKEELIRYFEAGMKNFSTGWINDTIYANTCIRYNGKETKKIPGRSFSVDFGTFIRGAMGKQQRWEEINKLKTRNYTATMIADGGSFSYTLGAFSAQSALESGSIFESLQGWNFLKNARYLHGEKPLSMHTLPEKIETARRFRADGIDPIHLRKAYNINSEYMVLFSLKHGLLLDPSAYLQGNQYLMEMVPLLVDSALRGSKAVPAAEFTGNAWIKRSGSGANTILICGNQSGKAVSGTLKIYPEYFDGKVPVMVPYYGGGFSIGKQKDFYAGKLSIPPRKSSALLSVALVGNADKVSAKLTGNGIDLTLDMLIASPADTKLELSGFGKLYRLDKVMVNGKAVNASSNKIALKSGQNSVKAQWHCEVFKFNADTWNKVKLLDGQNPPNFVLVADKGWNYRKLFYNIQLGYEYGTAGMFEDFVKTYDAEDGVFHNMPLPEWADKVDLSDKRWKIVFNGKAKENGVSISVENKIISIDGTTLGNCRRQAVVLLRLMDRTYPHAGMMLYPRKQQFDRNTGLQRGMFREKKVYEFFKTLPEQDFLFKPLFKEEFHYLYADGNKDFSGKYPIAAPPFIFEPTYTDDFVYGFTGDSEKWLEFIRKNSYIKNKK